MAFDISRLRRGEKIAAVAAVVLFILMFFDWYTVSVSGGLLGGLSVGGSAWQAFGLIDIFLFVVIIAAIALAVLTATERTPALPVTMAVIVTALAALGTLLVLYRLIDTPVGDVPDGVDVSRTIWAFLGLIAVAAITYGGYLSMHEEGTSLGDVKAQASAAFDSASTRRDEGGTASAPPPPPPSTPAASEPPAAAPPIEPPAGASSGGEPPPPSTA
jgi:cation transport ATPase